MGVLFTYIFILVYLLSTTSSEGATKFSLSNAETLRAFGEQKWYQLTGKSSSSCWDKALNYFKSVSAPNCDPSQEHIKRLLALTFTRCHYLLRKENFPDSESCRLDDLYYLLSNPVNLDKIDSNTNHCASLLSETAFGVYIQFFNHIDSICFYVQSTLWQEKTENIVNLLVDASEDVLDKLYITVYIIHNFRNIATLQNSRMLEQQNESLILQSRIIDQSRELEKTVNSGQSTLNDAFAHMQIEIDRHYQSLKSIFHEVQNFVQRILNIQNMLLSKSSIINFSSSAQISDIESLLFYLALILVIYYITSPKSTKKIRIHLYSLCMLMILGEIFLQSSVFKRGMSKYLNIRIWRLLGIITGLVCWTFKWWTYRDSTTIILESLNSGLKDIKEQIFRTIAYCVAGNVHFSKFLERYQNYLETTVYTPRNNICTKTYSTDDTTDSDYVPSSTQNTTTTSSVTLLTSNDMELTPDYDKRNLLSPKSSELDTGEIEETFSNTIYVNQRSPIETLHRSARPLAYRAPRPGCLEDVKLMRLNPMLLFETPKQFFEQVTEKTTMMERSILQHCHQDFTASVETNITVPKKSNTKKEVIKPSRKLIRKTYSTPVTFKDKPDSDSTISTHRIMTRSALRKSVMKVDSENNLTSMKCTSLDITTTQSVRRTRRVKKE